VSTLARDEPFRGKVLKIADTTKLTFWQSVGESAFGSHLDALHFSLQKKVETKDYMHERDFAKNTGGGWGGKIHYGY
jgi:hypothetical protein